MKINKIIPMLIILLSFFNTPRVLAFNDVNAHWADKDIAVISSKGIFGGFPDGSFRPQEPVTRAQFAKIVTFFEHASGDAAILQLAEQIYSDVDEKHWARGVIAWCSETSYMMGLGNNLFAANKTLTRAEAAVVFNRLLKLPQAQSELSYKDEAQIPSWAKVSAAAAKESGILSGYGDGSFKPKNTITRGELAALLSRAADYRGEKYEGYATLTFVDGVNKKVQLKSYGQTFTLYYDSDLAVYKKHRTRLGQIYLPAKVYYIISADGKLKYLEITDNKEAINLEFALTKAHTSTFPAFPGEISENAYSLTADKTKAKAASEELLEAINAHNIDSSLDGRGITVAVIDSGIDVGHPDLRYASDGSNKVVLWKDFTQEGYLTTPEISKSVKGGVYTGLGIVKANTLITKSGSIRIGYLKELDQGIDFNTNNVNDSFAVAVVDAAASGVYDTVYIDTNNNKDFDDEKPLKLFAKDKSFTGIPSANGSKFNLIASEIDPKGSYVHFGFDAAGHGTGVAATLAGNGSAQGIAPGAKLMIIKVVDKAGRVSYDRVLQAVVYAANNGAQIVNMSFGFKVPYSNGQNELGKLIAKYSKEKNIVFVAAAGNTGPGLTSINSPALSDGVIGVSGLLTPQMYKLAMGKELPGVKLLPETSIGPRFDGALTPLIAAPALTVSAVPLHQGGYSVGEGTSLASPIVAGSLARILQAGKIEGKAYTPQQLAEAIYSSAKAIGFGTHEVGGGMLDVASTLKLLKSGAAAPQLELTGDNPYFGKTSALFIKDALPVKLGVNVKNAKQQGVTIVWQEDSLLKPYIPKMFIPADSERTAWFDVNTPREPGVYGTVLQAMDEVGNKVQGRYPITIIKPVNSGSYLKTDKLAPGDVRRYFIDVPEGSASFVLKLTSLLEQNVLPGRLRLYVIRPNGELEKDSGIIGSHTDSNSYSLTLEKPQAGRWEIVVQAEPDNVLFSLEQITYSLSLWSSQAAEKFSSSIDNSQYFVHIYTKQLANTKKSITLTLRERATMVAVKGNIRINGLLYTLDEGRVNIISEKSDENKLRISLP